MRVLPEIRHFRRFVDGAILPEYYAGFDDQDFLELVSESMWCLRNANRWFCEDAKPSCPIIGQQRARLTMPVSTSSGTKKNPRQFPAGGSFGKLLDDQDQKLR
jgi:hypothetical protein